MDGFRCSRSDFGLFRSNGLFRLLGLRLLILSNDEIADTKSEKASNHEESN